MSEEIFRVVQSALGAVGLVALIAYAFFTYKLLASSRTQVAELQKASLLARQELELRSRPWLSIENLIREKPEDDHTWLFTIANYGLGIALDTQIRFELTRELREGGREMYKRDLLGWPGNLAMGPGQRRQVDLHLREDEVQALDQGDQRVFLKFELTYAWADAGQKLVQLREWIPQERLWIVRRETVE